MKRRSHTLTAANTVTRTAGINPSTLQNLRASHLSVDAVIEAAIAEQRIVGAVVLVAREGELVYRRAAGLVDRLGENRSQSVPNNAPPSHLYLVVRNSRARPKGVISIVSFPPKKVFTII
jgi:hypothetical protein